MYELVHANGLLSPENQPGRCQCFPFVTFSTCGKHSRGQCFSFDYDFCYLLFKPGLQSLASALAYISFFYALKIFVD